MSIKSQFEFEKLKTIGSIVAQALQAMPGQVKPGVTTAELDALGAAVLAKHGARSSARQVYQFPGCACISVNDEAKHGVPGSPVIQPGDLVNLDLVAEKDGSTPTLLLACTCLRWAAAGANWCARPRVRSIKGCVLRAQWNVRSGGRGSV